MEIREIEAFIMVEQTGSFMRAARLLYLSQPAISRRIGLLERELGVPLFERTPNRTRLAEAGRVLLPHAHRILAAIRDGSEAVRGLEQQERGMVVLALVGTLANTRLTAQLRAFRTVHPLVKLVLRTALSDEVSAIVRRGEAHLGLRYFGDSHADITSTFIGKETLVAVCAARSRLVPGTVRGVRQLKGAPWVAFPVRAGSSSDFARVLEHRLAAVGLGGAEIIPVDSLTAQKRLIEADFGLGLLPVSSVEEELRLGTLRKLPIAALRATVPIVAIHRRQAYLNRAVHRLLAKLSMSLQSYAASGGDIMSTGGIKVRQNTTASVGGARGVQSRRSR